MAALSRWFKKPGYYRDTGVPAGTISTKEPTFCFLNIFFVWRFFVRGLGSLIPPVGIKNLFYRAGGIRMGNKAFIGESVYFIDGYTDDLIELEDGAVLSPKVILIAMAVPGDSFLKKKFNVVKIGKITVKRGAWIGAGAVLLPGVTVGEGAIVGANAVVTENVPDYEVWAGNPARYLKKTQDLGVLS